MVWCCAAFGMTRVKSKDQNQKYSGSLRMHTGEAPVPHQESGAASSASRQTIPTPIAQDIERFWASAKQQRSRSRNRRDPTPASQNRACRGPRSRVIAVIGKLCLRGLRERLSMDDPVYLSIIRTGEAPVPHQDSDFRHRTCGRAFRF
jgi:hypothetical protein